MSEEIDLTCPPSANSKRDAIHIAVVPVTAGEDLAPGAHVGLTGGPDYEVSKNADRLIGIISPFCGYVTKKGDRCWLLLYPYTITSLRHVWTHPDFKVK